MCTSEYAQHPTQEDYFYVKNGTVTKTNMEVAPAAAKDRLYLVNVFWTEGISTGLRRRSAAWDFIASILIKLRISKYQIQAICLSHDGSNLASVFKQLSPSVKERIKEYLAMQLSLV